MHGRDLLLLLFTGFSYTNGFLSPPRNQHLQLASTPQHTTRTFDPLPSQLNDNNDQKEVSSATETVINFDAAGLGNYLAPYLIAFLASIGITGAFVKFVLMDY